MRQDPKYFMLLNKVEVTLEFVESLPVHLYMSRLEKGIWKRKYNTYFYYFPYLYLVFKSIQNLKMSVSSALHEQNSTFE